MHGRTRPVLPMMMLHEVLLDEVPFLVGAVADGADWPGNRGGRDRRADLDRGSCPSMSARLQILPIMRCPDRRASGWPGDLSRRDAGARPAGFMDKRLVTLMPRRDDEAWRPMRSIRRRVSATRTR